jgi:formylmethanofuran dehydrogenase subunit E
MNLDRFSRPLAGEREPEVMEHCDSCGEELYEGQEVITWTEDEHFCDMDCFKQYMDVKEVVLGE